MSKAQDPSAVQPDNATDETEAPAFGRDDVQKMVNGALATHAKRTEKLIAESLAKFAEAVKPPPPEEQPEAAKSSKNVADSAEYRALLKRVEAAEKKQQEAEAKSKAEMDARRRDAAQSQLRIALEQKGFNKKALDVLVTAMAANGTLRYDEDGKPLIAVKRSRSKGAAADEETFEDFAAGVEDYAKTDEAAVFLPPPGGPSPAPMQRQQNGAAPRNYDRPAVSDDEMASRLAEHIAANGGLFRTDQ